MLENKERHSMPDQYVAYEQFRREGYHLAEELIGKEKLEKAKHDAILEYNIRTNNSECFDTASFKLYQAAQTIDSVLEIATDSNLLDLLEVFLGPNIIFTLNRHNHISSGRKGESKDDWHRDYGEWSRGLLTALVYCDDFTIDNGCTEIIPGSHNWYSPGCAINGGYYIAEEVFNPYRDLLGQAVPIPMKAGSVLLFDGLLFHRAGENLTNKTRYGIVLGYHSYDQLDARDLEEGRALLVRGENLYRGNDG